MDFKFEAVVVIPGYYGWLVHKPGEAGDTLVGWYGDKIDADKAADVWRAYLNKEVK